MHRCYDWVFWLSVWDNGTRCMFFYANFYLSVCVMRSFVLLATSVCIVCVSVRVSDWKKSLLKHRILKWELNIHYTYYSNSTFHPLHPVTQKPAPHIYTHRKVYHTHSSRLNRFSSQNRQIKVSLGWELWSSLMYGFTTYHWSNHKTQTWWGFYSVFRVVLFSLLHTRKTSEKATQKITHLYFHISRGKNKNATWGGNTIKLPYLSSLEGRWMSGLPWGNEGLWPLRGILSEPEHPWSAPGGPSNWLTLPGKIDRRDTNGRHLIV